jgi:membrane protein
MKVIGNNQSGSGFDKTGWKGFLLRIKDELTQDKIKQVAAGVAFFFFLALFPSLVAILSVYGLLTDESQMHEHFVKLAQVLPPKAHQLIADRLSSIAQQSGQTLGWGAVLSLLFSFWTANAGTRALIEGINIAYDQQDQRSFWKKNAVSFAFTIGGLLLGVICATVVVGFPATIDNWQLPDVVESILSFARWLVLAGIIMAGLAVVYKYAPAKSSPSFKWVSWGAFAAVALWTAGSLLFSWYVRNLANYEETYGSLAAVIILMLWFYMTSYVIILGAEVNAELEYIKGKRPEQQDQKEENEGPDQQKAA